jgi:hypothetical protein
MMLSVWARGRWSLTLAVLLAPALGACGGAAKPAEGAPDQSAESVAPAPAPLPPLEPAAEPAGVVLKLRVKSPGKLVDGVVGLAAIPFDWRRALAEDSPLGPGLERAIDLNAPLEAFVVLSSIAGREPSEAVSIGARGVDQVLAALSAARIEAVEGPAGLHYFPIDGSACLVGRSLGPSAARVVCSSAEPQLLEVQDYALRGLPREELSDAAVFVEAYAAPLREVYGRQLRSLQLLASVGARQLQLDHPKFDRAVTDAAVGLAEEVALLAEDADRLRFELRDREGGYVAVGTVELAGDRSFSAAAIGDLARRMGPAPPQFGALPATVSAAAYGRTLPATRTARVTSVLAPLLGGFAEAKGVSAPTVQRLERVVQTLGRYEGVSLTASGPLAQVRAGDSALLASTYTLWGVEVRQSEVEVVLRDVSSLLSSRELRELLELEEMPSLRSKGTAVPGVPGARVYEWALPKSWAEPLGALAEGGAGLDATAERVAALSRGYLVVAALDGFTWVSSGREVEAAAEPLRAMRARGTERLAEVGGLDALRERPAVAAGFTKIEGFVGSFSAALPAELARSWPSLLSSTPRRGQVPTSHVVEASVGAKTELRATVDVPEGFVADLAALVILAAGEL